LKQDSALISNSVRLFVYTPVLRQNSFRYTEMVEIISKLDSLIILTFGQLIAVTKFGRRSPLTGPQILERYCSKSQC